MNHMTESSNENQAEAPRPMTGAQTEDGRVVIVGPDGMAVEGPPREDKDDEEPRSVTELVEQPAKVMRIGNMIRQLLEELERLSLPFTEHGTPTEAELRIAQAQLVGWLEGLFHGIQTALFAQQMA